MAAVNGDGVRSGVAAAHLLGLLSVTAPRRRGASARDGASVEATRFRGIPVTNAPRTLIDIAADLPEDELAKACHEAGVRFRTTPRQVDLLLPAVREQEAQRS